MDSDFSFGSDHQISRIRNRLRPRLKPKAEKALHSYKPIKVKHNTPKTLTPDGKTQWGAADHDFECFKSFWYFADWINKLYSDLEEPIRLQELGNTCIRGSRGHDGPAYGRRYDIFFNQFKIGLLEICAGLERERKTVGVEVTINRIIPTMISYGSVYGFLQTVASLVASTDRPKYLHLPKGDTEYEYALSSIRAAIAALMWEMHQEDHPFPELHVGLSGTPDYYYELLQMKLDNDRPKPAPEQSVASPEGALRQRFAKMWSQRI